MIKTWPSRAIVPQTIARPAGGRCSASAPGALHRGTAGMAARPAAPRAPQPDAPRRASHDRSPGQGSKNSCRVVCGPTRRGTRPPHHTAARTRCNCELHASCTRSRPPCPALRHATCANAGPLPPTTEEKARGRNSWSSFCSGPPFDPPFVLILPGPTSAKHFCMSEEPAAKRCRGPEVMLMNCCGAERGKMRADYSRKYKNK